MSGRIRPRQEARSTPHRATTSRCAQRGLQRIATFTRGPSSSGATAHRGASSVSFLVGRQKMGSVRRFGLIVSPWIDWVASESGVRPPLRCAHRTWRRAPRPCTDPRYAPPTLGPGPSRSHLDASLDHHETERWPVVVDTHGGPAVADEVASLDGAFPCVEAQRAIVVNDEPDGSHVRARRPAPWPASQYARDSAVIKNAWTSSFVIGW